MTILGIGIALSVKCELGLGPWGVFHEGFSKIADITYGNALIITGLVVLSLWIPLKQRFNIGTVINILWLGTVVDVAMNNFDITDSIPIRVLGVAFSILMIGVGTSIYVGAGISTGPRDGVMVGLEQRGIKIGIARTIIELFALTSGWLMGGTVGYASPFMALLIGPIVQVVLPYVDFRKK
ncbi:MAG: hypothetical protein CL515_00255 [Actinobacteria bacterium]|nr:hypothetical protein [Actinomycetota bacterium]|tara:strand:+ start:9435 stop:9977 length:543 start_codon:yes stop_codon:yes gene_type:complete